MNRREFVTNIGLLSALGFAPKSLSAFDALSQSAYDTFNTSLKTHPQLIGYQNYTAERQIEKLEIEGAFPKDFNGSFYRNGPALFERNAIRYEHLFEGDGMIHAFNFNNGSVSYKNKFVKTQKFIKEQKANRFLYDFSQIGLTDTLPITSADSINSANTNILPVGDDIWALWEAGSAYSMNAESLETQGVVTLSNKLKGMPFSAHPKVEVDGTIWNFGLDYQSGKVIMYKLNPNGSLDSFGLLNTNYHAMLHDFLITEKHILIILPSLKIDPKGESFMQRQKFNPDQPMRVMVVDKNDFSLKSIHEFSPCYIFHFGNAWEDKDGAIRFDGCRYPNLDIMDTIVDVMKGKTSQKSESHAQSILFSILPNGKTSQESFDGVSEFPRIYPSLTGHKNTKVFTLSGNKNEEWMHSVRSINIDTGKTDEFDYGKEFLVEEHVVIEKTLGTQKDGWLMGTALHWPSKRSCISLFEAENIAAGPIARAWLPFHIPLGFHGNFKKSQPV